jgi:SPP1 gp7 family putative phage head morphogenesis protein
MLRYSLSRAVKRPKGTRVTLPPVQVRLAAEKQYYAELRRMLAQIATEVRESVLPAYQADMMHRRMIGDAATSSWFARLRSVINHLTGAASQMVGRILNLESQKHTENFMATAKKALGIDLSAVVRDEDLADYLQAAVDRNTSLITNLGDDIRQRIERTVYDNSIAGNSVATLKKQLASQFGIADRRAQLIARDQTSKFNSDLNKIRQQQAGITEYVFTTAHDERVRKTHAAMEGKTCRWDDPTVYRADDGSWISRSGGVELHPGQDINCRCVSRGIVVF